MSETLTLDTLKAELTALELRIVDRITRELNQKADRSHVESLERDLQSIKISGSPALNSVAATVQTNTHEIGELKETLARRGHINGDFIKHKADTERELKSQDTRIDQLVFWRNRTLGALAVVTFLMPVLATISWHLWG